MTIRLLAALAVALAFFIGGRAEAADFTYSATGGPGCTNIESKPELTSWRCPGPAGYSAVLTDTGNLVAVAFGPTGQENAIVDNDLAWQGAGKAFGEKLEWRMTGTKPYATILRIWRNDPAPQTGAPRTVEELLVVKISAKGACRVGTVSARRHDANAVARALADSTAASFRCGVNKPTAIGR